MISVVYYHLLDKQFAPTIHADHTYEVKSGCWELCLSEVWSKRHCGTRLNFTLPCCHC